MAELVQQKAQISKRAPLFECDALMPDNNFKRIKLSDFQGKWLVLFFYPLDFTLVCPTEIIEFSDRTAEFQNIGCNVLGGSIDSKYTHLAWASTPRNKGGLGGIQMPLISDITHKISESYGILLDEKGHTCRATFIIDPKGIVRHLQMNEPTVARNVDEILRLVQAFQYVDENGEACLAKWKPGQKSKPKSSQSETVQSGDKNQNVN